MLALTVLGGLAEFERANKGPRQRNAASELSAGVYFARKPNLLDISAFAELLYLADSGWLACSTKARPANLPSYFCAAQPSEGFAWSANGPGMDL